MRISNPQDPFTVMVRQTEMIPKDLLNMNASSNYQGCECAEGLREVVLCEDEGRGALTLHGDVVVDLVIADRTHKVVVLHHDV